MVQRGRPRKNSTTSNPVAADRKPESEAGADRVRSADYRHNASTPLRPEIGAAPQYLNQKKAKREPTTYRYDSSLAPVLEWDGNPIRELGEWLIARIQEAAALPSPFAFTDPQEFKDNRGNTLVTVRNLREATEQLSRMGKPFLNWTGKAERQSFEVPTLPLFVHERLSTKAIIDTLAAFRKQPVQLNLFDLFADPQHSMADQVLKAYEHQDKWANRMILGDSLVVMNSLLKYENLGGQVQMIYMDPPYGVKFGSNFQPFIKKRDVGHNDDEDLTREPEMVQAYRDTWELGIHSYLGYMRDRLTIARCLLSDTGSIFIQISDENFHYVRMIMDEVFGGNNLISTITFRKGMALSSEGLPSICDYVLWYAKDASTARKYDVFIPRSGIGESGYDQIELSNGEIRRLTAGEISGQDLLPLGAKVFATQPMHAAGYNASCMFSFSAFGKTIPPPKQGWKTNETGMNQLLKKGRLVPVGSTLRYKIYFDDYPVSRINNVWTDVVGASDKLYVVQTSIQVVERCIHLATLPGDLVLDPTCGSGTTAFVSEKWGRRWITCDTSRVPLALARQRLLTATFPWYQLKDMARGPSGGFHYERRQNRKGEEVGGIVPHITLKSIANNEPPAEEVLVDRPERDDKTVRVCGPFVVEGTIPPAQDLESGTGVPPVSDVSDHGRDARATENDDPSAFTARMIEILRKTPILRLAGNKQVKLSGVRPPARSLSLHAEAIAVNGEDKPTAFVFGPENGQVVERLVVEALREAQAKQFKHLVVIGFAIHPNARQTIEHAETLYGLPASYVQATPDLLMGDLLKNLRSSQIFSVCGLPEIAVKPADGAGGDETAGCAQVEILGLDVFDPITMEVIHRRGDEVPAWFLDTNYNGMCFKVSQAFFPKTGAWDSLKKSLRITHDASVWDHLAGTVSAPFHVWTSDQQIAVKVIDERGNELVVTKQVGFLGKKGKTK